MINNYCALAHDGLAHADNLNSKGIMQEPNKVINSSANM